ncbi:DUF3102 domain-containing protein [uncultured Flavonifractor sp.]|uniref:DUF3102 domain-containing protein n=1 Tax=uncultured Flavonifractor sp. TaxID=1193534 RepID=UPI002602EEBB|nr:DUF3102 domain-containing protein [uncultured Flavonifractor sp.]
MGKPDLGALIAQTMNPPPRARSIEVITGEIVELKKQAGEAILGIGQRLIEAKEMLPHGEWLPWLTERVEFSERTAQNFIRLAREWSNPQALADLGATKALTLLALPPEEREQFIEDHNVIDMSTRQLEQAIKERDEARAAAQRAEADKRTAEQARAKMAEDMKFLNIRLSGAKEDREQAMQDVARLEAELADLKAQPVDVAVETVVDQAAIEKARAEAVAEMQAKLDKAREKQKKAEAQRQEAQEQLEAARRKLEEQAKAEKQENLAGDKEWAQFELLFNQAKDHANQMLKLLFHARGREDQATAQIMEKALMALSEQIGRCAK